MFNKNIIIGIALCSLNASAANDLNVISPMDHSQHVPNNSIVNTEFTYQFPNIDLIDHNNQVVELNKLFDRKKNVVFAFFFTHCVSVCTTITLSLQSIQPQLTDDTLIAMISIDPETDTPDILKAYVETHKINDTNWVLLTGDNDKIVQLQKTFEAYRGNKMNHSTSLFLKTANSDVITEIKNNFSVIPKILTKG